MTPSNSLLKLKKILESRTGKAIGDYNMIEDGDTVQIGKVELVWGYDNALGE